MTTVLTIVLVAFGVYLSAYVLYQALLFAANTFVADPGDANPAVMRRFNVFIPAHNEELHLPRLLASLAAQQYPGDRYRVTVIADNCSDRTAAAASAFDVDVLERTDAERRGKGYAIGWALGRIDADRFDAVVVVDADSIVAPGFLAQVNLRMDRGDQVVQCYNGVANPGQSWFTRLLHVSRTISNEILHPGRAKLGVSSQLMGNGMCFAMPVLAAHPWNAFSVAEDWEYYARLVKNGVHIGYARNARVYHQESVNFQQASSQRMRWSGGRFQMLRRHGLELFVRGVRAGDPACIDACASLVLPNPSLGMNLTVFGLGLAAAHWALGAGIPLIGWYLSLAAIQFGMFMVGVLRTEQKAASAMSLFFAPVFLAWKMGIDILSVCGVGTRQWKPTERKL